MAEPQKDPQKDLVARLTEVGGAAMKTLGEAPGAERFVAAANALRERLDDLQKRVRGLEELEERIAKLERKVERLSKESSAAKGKPSA
jgi:tetrahydromethanopterin S-methyltransferase subunit G